MKIPLNTFQRKFAMHRLTFGQILRNDLLSPEIAESLRRASLACMENQKTETGIVDFVCGLYLQYREQMATYFMRDFDAVVTRTFPIHRFGPEGHFPKIILDQMASGAQSSDAGSAFSYSFNYEDELLRLLWLSAKLANAVGKKASLMDVVAALGLDRDWMNELEQRGLTPRRDVADFDKEVGTIVFHISTCMGTGWPREMDFERGEILQPPFQLEVSTPSGPFPPVRSARVKLNEIEVASIVWPEKQTTSISVELRSSNKIEFELDGSAFGGIEVTVRGNPN
jgi:hypothetical protein